jgi:hypothetical protein
MGPSPQEKDISDTARPPVVCITDCTEENAAARLSARLSALFGQVPTVVPLRGADPDEEEQAPSVTVIDNFGNFGNFGNCKLDRPAASPAGFAPGGRARRTARGHADLRLRAAVCRGGSGRVGGVDPVAWPGCGSGILDP